MLSNLVKTALSSLALTSTTLASQANPANDIFSSLYQGDEGHLDAPMEKTQLDGRLPGVTSIFEQMRQKHADSEKSDEDGIGHSMLKAGSNVDVPMEMFMDWNHVITLKLSDNDEEIKLIPSTGMADTILMHEDCNGCWSMIKSKWTPSRDQVVGGATAPLTKKTFSYIYMMSIEDVSA